MDVKKFTVKLLFFVLIAAPILSLKNVVSYYTGSYKKEVSGSEVYRVIEKSKKKKKVKKLLIGDSVASQLYSDKEYNDSIFSLNSNQAISMVGQYILLANFIDANKNNLPEEVLLMTTPDSFSNNLNQSYSFHYFLKPFYFPSNSKYFDDLCLQQIKQIRYYYACKVPFIRSSNWSPEYEADMHVSYKILSPLSIDYIEKIKRLCSENHIKFSLMPTPIKASRRETMIAFSKDKEVSGSSISSDLNIYFSKIVYVPDSLFRDNRHFNTKDIPVDFFKLRG